MSHSNLMLSSFLTVGFNIDYQIIHLLIHRVADTPFSVDPFSFVSSCLEDFKTRQTNPTSLNPSFLNPNQPEFAVPALPPRLISTPNGGPLPTTNTFSSNSPVPKKVPAVPKSTFPDIHMPLLIEKFAQLQSASISALVESIHLDLREHKVKKTAIEAKVREVGEKCKEKKVWVIKPSLLVRLCFYTFIASSLTSFIRINKARKVFEFIYIPSISP